MSASSFVKSKFGKEAYRQRSYQNSKLRHTCVHGGAERGGELVLQCRSCTF